MSAVRQRQQVLVACLSNHCWSPLTAAALARHGPPGIDTIAGLAANL
jgi:hypothetical protein